MILDSIENLELYTPLHQQFEDVITFLRNTYLMKLDNGKHTVNDKGMFASVSEYDTKPEEECFIECHRKYIDIQVLATGHELIGHVPAKDCEALPYDETKDFQKLIGTTSPFSLKPGMFAIFFPHDGHKPNMRNGTEPSRVKKIVFKVPVIA